MTPVEQADLSHLGRPDAWNRWVRGLWFPAWDTQAWAVSGVQWTPRPPVQVLVEGWLEVPAADRGPVPLRWTLGESFHGRGDNKRLSQRPETAAWALRDIQSYISGEMYRASTWNSIRLLRSAVELLVKTDLMFMVMCAAQWHAGISSKEHPVYLWEGLHWNQWGPSQGKYRDYFTIKTIFGFLVYTS